MKTEGRSDASTGQEHLMSGKRQNLGRGQEGLPPERVALPAP